MFSSLLTIILEYLQLFIDLISLYFDKFILTMVYYNDLSDIYVLDFIRNDLDLEKLGLALDDYLEKMVAYGNFSVLLTMFHVMQKTK
jgi:hypothetical protein